MIHNIAKISRENASPWPSAMVARDIWERPHPIRKSGLGLWRGVAIGLPISIGIWGGIALMVSKLI